jgi:4-diphosphocytidyl-2-C-methyl-D-erythritol kinase
MIVFPNAKINLGLYVVSRRSDGYHNLETVFYPIPLWDALEMVDGSITNLSVSGIKVECRVNDNLIMKAYEMLKHDFNLPPVRFHLHKVIPFGAGLAGGSSDAAFTLKMLNDYFSLQLSVQDLKNYAAKIGADCPFFVDNLPMLAKGTGNALSPANIDLSGYKIVIVKPPVAVRTADAYRDTVPEKALFNLKDLPLLPVEEWKGKVENVFEKTIFPLFPEIKKCKETLYDAGAIYASMSGSGSAVFGIFHSLPEDLKKIIPEGILFTL